MFEKNIYKKIQTKTWKQCLAHQIMKGNLAYTEFLFRNQVKFEVFRTYSLSKS